MSMVAKKNLTLSSVKAKSKKIDKMEKYEIEEGEYKGETISFYPIFSTVKIEELLEEYQLLIKEASDKKIELSEQMNIPLLQFLTITHFTHFKKDIPSTLLSEGKKVGVLDWLDHFRSTGLYELIITEVFLQSEMKKVFDGMTSILGASLLLENLENDVRSKSTALKNRFSKEVEQISTPLQ